MRLWDAFTARRKSTLTEHKFYIWSVVYSPDGSTIAIGGRDGAVRLVEVVTSQVKNELKGHIGSVRSVAYSPDGNTIASGSEDHSVLLWDLAL